MPTKVSPMPPRFFVIVDDNTISDTTRDRQEEKRPRKRARVDSDDEGPPAPAAQEKTAKPTWVAPEKPAPIPRVYVRDPEFYKEELEADTHILVEKVMFKIHGMRLDSCPWMYDILLRHGKTSESNPLEFNKQSVEEYKAFLWAIYASPEDLRTSPHEPEYLERLALIASMTMKYKIPKLEDWAKEFFEKLVVDTVFLSSCSSACLTHLVDTCIAFTDKPKLATVVNHWIRRVENKDTPSVPAIIAADRFDLKDLRGVAYYAHVQDMIDRLTSNERGAIQLRADPKLNNGQVMRILTGYMSLVSLWERQRTSPIALPRAVGGACTDATHVRCTATWERRWISAAGWKRILGISSADTLALYACLRDQLMNDDDLKAGMDPDCRLAGLEALRDIRTKIKADMADHFFGIV